MTYDGFLIAGPTASGKSRLALEMANQYQAVIINADSMQIYKELPLISASPDPKALLDTKHYLYNYIDYFSSYSVGHWYRDLKDLLQKIENKKFIIVGGTGLYFHALLGKLAKIPKVSEEIREKWREKLEKQGPQELHKILCNCDFEGAKKINSQDGQRIVRALEIFDMTKKTLSFWQTQKQDNLLKDKKIKKMLLMPERKRLYKNIEDRFDMMIKNHVVDEVKDFFEKFNIQETKFMSLPFSKMIGVIEIYNYLNHKITLEDAITLSKTRSRQYAKRQMTWFRNRLGDDWIKI